MKIAVVTSYPERYTTHGKQTVGGASYTKQLLEEIKRQHPNDEISVFAESFDKTSSYFDNDIKVFRVFKNRDLLTIIKLFWNLLNNKINTIFVSFEINMFGSKINAGVFFASLVILKLFKKKIVVALHQAPKSVEGYERLILPIFYKLINLSSSKIIVFEKSLKSNIVPHIDFCKIEIIPHFVLDLPQLTQKDNDVFTALCFGYVSPYKGIEELVNSWPNSQEYKLIIAGGINPLYKKSKVHIEYFNNVKHLAKKKNIKVTGFVEENDIKNIFASCDCVLLPYQAFFSSSGPLSFALTFQKPFLVSEPLLNYFKSDDFVEALNVSGLKKETFLLTLDEKKIQTSIQLLKKHKNKINIFLNTLKCERSINKVADKFYETINS